MCKFVDIISYLMVETWGGTTSAMNFLEGNDLPPF